MLAHWWVGLGSRTSVSPETSKARGWCLAAGPRDPRAGVGPWWLGLVFDTAGCRGGGVLKLVLACWPLGLGPSGFQGWCWPAGGWAESCPGRLQCCRWLGAGVCPLVGEGQFSLSWVALQGMALSFTELD